MLRTTVAGGWPAPARYENDLRRYYAGEISERQAEPMLVAAAAAAMREQKATGVSQVMSGGLSADPFLAHLVRYLTGIERVSLAAAGSRTPGFYRLAGRLAAPRGLGYAAAFAREKALDPSLLKASCPGPYTLLSNLLLADASAFSALPHAVDIVRTELSALARAGAREVQIDVPTAVSAVCLLNHDASEVANTLSRVFRGVRNAARTVHLCLRGLSGASLGAAQRMKLLLPVIERLRGKVDRVLVECVDEESRQALSRYPADLELVAGIADVNEVPEPVELLVSRARELLRHIPAERLWLSPSCGLRAASRAHAVGTLTNTVAAARRLPG